MLAEATSAIRSTGYLEEDTLYVVTRIEV